MLRQPEKAAAAKSSRRPCPVVHCSGTHGSTGPLSSVPSFHCPIVLWSQRPLSHCPLSRCIVVLPVCSTVHGPIIPLPTVPFSLCHIVSVRHCANVFLSYCPNGYLPIAPWSHCPSLPLSLCPAHCPSLAMMCCTLLFYPTPQDPTHRTKIALGNLEAAIAQLGDRQTKDPVRPRVSAFVLGQRAKCDASRGHTVLLRQRRPTKMNRPGLGPGISGSGGRRLIH